VPKPPSFNERDVSDKPLAISKLPPVSPRDVRHLDRRWRCTLATMSAADQGVGRVMRALKRSGQLDNTIVFYMSDNGFYFGEHRILSGKQYPYEPGLRVPYAVRVPARYRERPQPAVSTEVVSNEDATPTILDYAGGLPSCRSAKHCRRIDGRPLQPLLGDRGPWPADRGVLAEIAADQGAYSAVRTERWIYVRYDDAQSELYDLRRDPAELLNLAGKPAYAQVEAELGARLNRLRRCSGARGVVAPVHGKPLCE
jgi:N-acetylglucosamine-6-sulfatase